MHFRTHPISNRYKRKAIAFLLYIILAPVLSISISYSQDRKGVDYNFITIYDLKKKPYSCACNLESLFDNWNVKDTGISNADDLTLVSYTYIGTIRDTAHILEYANRLFEPETMMGLHRRSESAPIYIMTNEEWYKDENKTFSPERYDAFFREFKQETEEAYLLALRPGDMIFSVKFRFKGRDELFEVFEFCDPKKNHMMVGFHFGTRSFYDPSRNKGSTAAENSSHSNSTSRRRNENISTTKPYFDPNPSPFSDPF